MERRAKRSDLKEGLKVYIEDGDYEITLIKYKGNGIWECLTEERLFREPEDKPHKNTVESYEECGQMVDIIQYEENLTEVDLMRGLIW